MNLYAFQEIFTFHCAFVIQALCSRHVHVGTIALRWGSGFEICKRKKEKQLLNDSESVYCFKGHYVWYFYIVYSFT